MTREAEIRRIVASIVHTGLGRIRAYASAGLADQCFFEADHIHHLPPLATDPQLDLLLHYLDVVRPAFIERAVSPEQFQADWVRLRSIADEMSSTG